MLESRPIQDVLIRTFSLQGLYGAKDMTAARKKLADRTVIQSEKNGFISISFTDKDRERAAVIANAYTDQLCSMTRALATIEASQRRIFYEKQLSDARSALVEAEGTFQQVQLKKGIVQPTAQAVALIQSISALRAQISAKTVQLQALRGYLTETNANVQLVKQELDSLQQQLAGMEQHNRDSGVGIQGLGDIPAAGGGYLQAQHEVQYRQAVYDLLMKQYDAARLDEAKEAVVIQVVEPAIPPERRSSPAYPMILLISVVAGLILGVFMALVSWAKLLLQSDPERSRQLGALKDAVLGRTVC